MDEAGNLYVREPSGISKFSPSGHYINTVPVEIAGERTSVKLDQAGDLLMKTEGRESQVVELGPSGGFLGYLTPEMLGSEPLDTTEFTVDPSLGDLYQDTGSFVAHYDPSCEPINNPVGGCQPLDTFGLGDLSQSGGIDIDANTGAIYVVNAGSSDVAVFTDSRPKVTTEAPTELSESGATLHGSIDPAGRGNVTKCSFEYGTTVSYGQSIPCGEVLPPLPSGEEMHASARVEQLPLLSSLPSNTRFHYRLVAKNSTGAVGLGPDLSFLTTRPPNHRNLFQRSL